MNLKISEYLAEVEEKSNDKTSRQFDFSPFEMVNIYLIRQALKKQEHLWLKPCDSKITQFYQPLLFAVVIEFFEKNYCDGKKTKPEIGDKYQKGRERYKVTAVNCDHAGMKNAIKLEKIRQSNSSSVLYTCALDDYTKLDNRTEDTNRDTFKPMKSFIKKTLGVQEIILSFPHRFAIVATKKRFEACFKNLDKKAFPYTYIANSGKETKNLPSSESMFFVTSDYETIKKYIFDRDICLDTIIFMENKYDDQLQQDIDRDYFKTAIFIGENNPGMQRLLQWHWTLPEYNYFFDNFPQGKIEPIRVNNEVLTNKIEQFIQYIKQLEKDYSVNLKKISPYTSYILPLIVLSKDSRLKNGVDFLQHSFQRKLEQVLGKEFSNTGADYKEINKKLIDDYRVIIEQIDFKKNAKTQALKQTKQTKKTDYLLMPKGQTLHIWQEEIKCLGWLNTEVISSSKFKALEKQSSITILALEDYDFYATVKNSKHRIEWLLYTLEYQQYKKFVARYDKELITEYHSKDRKKLIGIDYPATMCPEMAETVDEVIDRIYDNEPARSEYTTYQDHINIRITFEHASIELSANTSVILINQNDQALEHKVRDLMIGDKIRIYENKYKEILFDIACKDDRQGKFNEILAHAKLWKDILTKYCKENQNCIDDKKIAEIASDCDVDTSTVKGWLRSCSKTKFPQNIEPLKNILGNDYPQILKSQRSYHSIMIALGRDLSDEISGYIIAKKKGKLLEEFDDNAIKKISEHNMPIRSIKQIDIILDKFNCDTKANRDL